MLFFFAGALCLSSENAVVTLTDKVFSRRVEHRSGSDVWIVMFNENTPACKRVQARFRAAADVSFGMVNFGSIDIDRFPTLKEKYNVTALPSFRIFHSGGDLPYTGRQKAASFLKTAMFYLRDASEPIQPGWRDEMLRKPSALYFAKNSSVPAVWVGVSSFFQKKRIRCGFSNDTEVAGAFGVREFPTILFMNGTNEVKYDGDVDFKSVRLAMEEFFAKQLGGDEEMGDEFMTPDEFIGKCYGGRNLCVLSVSTAPTEEMRVLQKRLASHKIRWFVGKLGVPEKFMESGGVWIYNPRRDGYIRVNEEETLSDVIERVLDGTAKWSKKATFEDEL